MDMQEKMGSEPNGEEDLILPGFRFHPTDEELVGFYLRRKIDKKPISIEVIKEIDVYKYDPWDLPRLSTVGDREWYFFCVRGRKYRNSIRPNRVTGSGFWKATGIDRPIYSTSSGGPGHECIIGLKKSLVYYRGSAGKGTKTDWMMHEFRLPSSTASLPKPALLSSSSNKNFNEPETWTICRIFKRIVSQRKYVPEWKQATSKETVTTDSSSSLESETINQYSGFGVSHFDHFEQKPLINQYEEKTIVFPGQISDQSPVSNMYQGFQSGFSGNLLGEFPWDDACLVVNNFGMEANGFL
ncbi:transcription factor JUNGBRUNNEN 1 [Amborella trichopoda]|uniref:NAC domain-containing protein n=1 Tax=Amborella trichopoda TaxID=13333 RepID=U5CXY1_AMBTC|nr:transcription factor JUNGBRUNNEN 1 [Amborella trichopoda]ERN14840.1 hypothetical protein AMTR_s00032p00126420 [Amborella trichopoda]|eukprot:XP_006853373.1 transcription factor JUNGBRUNNEN 1 [Amborella trichopoda]